MALLRKLQGQQSVVSDGGNLDILGVAEQGGEVAILVLFVRLGRVIGSKAFFPRIPLEESRKQALSAFILQYYLNPLHSEEPIERIVTSHSLPDKESVQSALQASLNRKIMITDRKHAPYRQWQTMADTNSSYALSQHLAKQ